MVTAPTVFVTKGRQRVKQFSGYGNGSVYLKNGDEFEVELFNPTQSKVLARISLNGKSLGSGIVLRPGERVFLERYFDEARKFKFETYEVNGADSNAVRAIKMNGIIDVEFFQQYTPCTVTCNAYPSWTYTYGYPSGGYVNPSYTHINNSVPISGSLNISGNINTKGMSMTSRNAGSSVMYCSSNIGAGNPTMDANVQNFSRGFDESAVVPLETGRVEKGSNSQQFFDTDNTTFNSYYTWKTTWTIMPESQKPLVYEDLNVYCPGCRAKRKKTTHKFCPNCGMKF